MNDVKNTILNKITAGEVVMKPRWHFVLRSVLYVTGAVMVLVAATYIVSFIGFVLRLSGVLYVPSFGLAGIAPFLLGAPWLLIGLAVIFMIVLQVLVRHFAFAYQKPLVYSVVAMLLFVAFGTIFIMQTTIHERLYERAQQAAGVPLVGGAYRQFVQNNADAITVGTVTGVEEWRLQIEDTDGVRWIVNLSVDTRQPRNAAYAVGDAVLIFGERETNWIDAIGVRRAEDVRALRERIRESRSERNQPPARLEEIRSRQ